MRYIWQHIKAIIENYDGTIPLAHFLKNYFKQYPILGSRDRKTLGAMAFSWYRVQKGIIRSESAIGIEEQIRACMNLCGNEKLLPALIDEATIQETSFDVDRLFPYDMPLSVGIDKKEWLNAMLVQPFLFLRIRKDMGKITSLLNGAAIPYTFITDNCLRLPNGAKIDTILPEDAYAVQDASSQQTGTYFRPKKQELWYDCCAGAGGKSLLLTDLEPGIRLTVSDVRESIIHNLKQRFKQYRMESPVAYVTDVSNPILLSKALGTRQFDNIICDAPCSGSGTWARTPEQLYFFDPKTAEKYSALQSAIAINVSRHLKTGGRLIYITCSVFKQENEEVVNEIIENTRMKLIDAELINGSAIGADSMFVTEFEKVN